MPVEERTRTLVSLSAAELLGMLGWLGVSAVLPILKNEWSLSGTESGAILSASQAGYVLSVLAMGYSADRIGGRRTFIGSALVAAVFGSAFAFLAHDFYSALALRILMGIGNGGLYVPGMRILSDWYAPSERGKAIGIYTCSVLGADAGGYYIAGPIAAKYGWQAGILSTTFWAFLAVCIAYIFVKDAPKTSPNKAERQASFQVGELLRNRRVWLINLSYIGHMWELYPMRLWIGPYLYACARTLGYGASDALFLGSLMSATCLIMGVFSPGIGGYLSDRIGRSKSIVIIMSMSIPCSLAYGWMIGTQLWLLASVGLFYGFWIVADTAVFKAGLTELVPERHVGTALGIQSFLGFGATTVATITFGATLDLINDPSIVEALGYFTSWGWAFSILGIIASISPISAILLMRGSTAKKVADDVS
jgi:MFS family permease